MQENSPHRGLSNMQKKLDGKKVSAQILGKLKQELVDKKLKLTLGIILVGDDEWSRVYIKQKKEAGAEIGVDVKIFEYPANISVRKLRAEVSQIAKRHDINGLIVQLHLPDELKAHEQRILNTIPLNKDVDVLSERAVGKLTAGVSPVIPPTIAGILRLLEEYKIDISGKHIAIIGNGPLVGRPAEAILTNMRYMGPITLITWDAQKYAEHIAQADIVISGVSKSPNLIQANMLKKGAIVIDAAGNLDHQAIPKTSFYTPKIGGVGPMTVAMLFFNLIALHKQNKKTA